MKTLFIMILVLLSLPTVTLQALSLEEAVNEVLYTNPVVKERLNNYNKTTQDLKIAKSEFLPSVDFESRIGYERTYDKSSITGFQKEGYHTYINSLTLTQNIFNGFSSVERMNFEKARVLAAAYNYVEKTNDVAFNVVREYINVLKNYELYLLEQENVALTTDIFNKIQEINESGFGTLSDVKKVDSTLQLAQFNLLTQENNWMDSEFNFAKLLGRKITNSELQKPTFDYILPTNLDDATLYAMEHNPSMVVSKYNLAGAKALYRQSETQFLPTLDFELSKNVSKNTDAIEGHNNDFSAMFIFRYNLFNGGADLAGVKKYKSNIHQEFQIQRDLRRQIIEGLQLSWSAYTMIEKQLTFLKSYQEFSKRTLELYRQEFENGQRTLLDLLTAQDDFITSKIKTITAEYDWLFAKYRILDAMGEMVNSIFNKNTQEYLKPLTADYEPVNSEPLPLLDDVDVDNVMDKKDICDNSLEGTDVSKYGCKDTMKAMPMETQTQEVIPQAEVMETQSDTMMEKGFKERFLAAEGGYTIGVATYSSMEQVNEFIQQNKLEDSAFSFPIKLKKEYIKVVSGIYPTITEAKAAIAGFSESMMIHKPYVDTVKRVQSMYLSNK